MLPEGVHPAGRSSTLMKNSFYEAIVEATRRRLILQADGSFVDEGSSSVQPSGKCGLSEAVSTILDSFTISYRVSDALNPIKKAEMTLEISLHPLWAFRGRCRRYVFKIFCLRFGF
jgi:hypothetical protein